MNLVKKTLQLIILTALSIFLFDYSLSLKIIDPTNIKWLLSVYHDWGQHYLGWAYFRVEDWSFPIGNIANYNYPIGTNIGYTDSIPVLAIFFKLIRSVLPENFQYLGLWMFISYMLLAFYTVKILKIYKINFLYSLILLTFILANPVLIFRAMHPALFGHWILIAALYFHLKKPYHKKYHLQNIQLTLLIIFSAVVNPYLFAMVFGFSIITPFKQAYFDKVISPKYIIIYPSLILFLTLFLWYIIGFLEFESTVNMGVNNSYGIYGLNLNSLINPLGFSNYLPSLKRVSDFQYEGYMYLGIGMMSIFFFSTMRYIYLRIRKREQLRLQKRHIPLFILGILLALFSITGTITIGNQVVLEIPLPDIVYRVGNIFRASARFFWLPYYLIIFFSFINIVKSSIPKTLKYSFLSILLLLQITDIHPMLTYRNLEHGDYVTPLNEKEWETLFSEFDIICTYPPFDNHLLNNMDYQDLDYLALKVEKPITNGYVARNNLSKKEQFINKIEKELLSTINPEHLFVTTEEHLEDFRYQFFNKKINTFQLDDYYIIYSKNKQLKNPTFFSEHNNKYDSIYKVYSLQTILTERNIPRLIDTNLQYNFEKIYLHNNLLKVSGWSFIKDLDNRLFDSIYITLSNKEKTYLHQVDKKRRLDLVSHFNRDDIENMGFSFEIFSDSIVNQKFTLGFAFKTINNSWIYSNTHKRINQEIIPMLVSAHPPNDASIKYNIENVTISENNIEIKGWAFIPDQNSSRKTIKLFLVKENQFYEISTEKIIRQDVTKFLNSYLNLDASGFKIKFKQNSIPIGNYQLGVSIYDSTIQNYIMVKTKKTIEINY